MITIFKPNPIRDLISNSFIRETVQIIGGALLLSLCSQIKIPLPFSIVPLTLQTLCILLFGGLFGSRKSALIVLAYWAQILMGWPVVAGGLSNPLIFMGPKGGYYLGFLVQAFCMGWITERSKEFNSKRAFWAGLAACAIQLGMGVCWLTQFIGFNAALIMGLYPFIPGEILKVIAVCAFLKKAK